MPAKGWRPQPLKSGQPVLDNQDAGIQLTYDLLDSALKNAASSVKGSYQQAKSSTRHIYDVGSSMLNAADSSLTGLLGKQFSDLGLSEATQESLAGIHGELARAMKNQAVMRSNDLSELNLDQAGDYSVARGAISGAAREKAQSRVDARNSLDRKSVV